MAMTVSINVKGSVILYLNDEGWNMVFVTEKCHNLKFTDPTSTKPTTELAEANYPFTIEFSATGKVPKAEWGVDEVQYFMNMNDSRLHGKGVTGDGFLVVDPKSNKGCQWVHVKIPFGVVKHSPIMSHDYYYRGYYDLNSRDWNDGVSKGFTIEFDLEDGEELTMRSSNPRDRKPRKFKANARSLDLEFDNDCLGRIGYNDFEHFYDWVFDTTSPARDQPKMFVAGKKRFLKVFAADASDREIEEYYLQYNKKLMSIDGNCDPVIIDPPPGD